MIRLIIKYKFVSMIGVTFYIMLNDFHWILFFIKSLFKKKCFQNDFQNATIRFNTFFIKWTESSLEF